MNICIYIYQDNKNISWLNSPFSHRNRSSNLYNLSTSYWTGSPIMRYEFMKIIWEYVILLYEKFGDVVCWLWTIELCWVWWQWWRLIDQKNLDNLGTLTIEPQPTKVVLVVPNICPSKLLPIFVRIFGCDPPPAGSREKWQNVAKEDTEHVPRNWRICRKFM